MTLPTFQPGDNVFGRGFRANLNALARLGASGSQFGSGWGDNNSGISGAGWGTMLQSPPMLEMLLAQLGDDEDWERGKTSGVEDDVDSAWCDIITWVPPSENAYKVRSEQLRVYNSIGAENPKADTKFWIVKNYDSGRWELLLGLPQREWWFGDVLDSGCEINPYSNCSGNYVLVEPDPCAGIEIPYGEQGIKVWDIGLMCWFGAMNYVVGHPGELGPIGSRAKAIKYCDCWTLDGLCPRTGCA